MGEKIRQRDGWAIALDQGPAADPLTFSLRLRRHDPPGYADPLFKGVNFLPPLKRGAGGIPALGEPLQRREIYPIPLLWRGGRRSLTGW